MKKASYVFSLVLVTVFVFAATAKTDTILFPYINENPGNVSTIISVINGTSCIGGSGSSCTGGSVVGALHYRYITKPISGAADPTSELADALSRCAETNFCRPTTYNDVVSFDASGNVASGNALFNDPTAYGASFVDTLTPGPRRGYLLVTHATAVPECADITTTNVDSPNAELDGEATLIDIVNGEAWGYKAVLNSGDSVCANGCNFSFLDTDDVLVENGRSFYENTVIYPPALFSQRYFVTPVLYNATFLDDGTIRNDDMSNKDFQKRTNFGLMGWGPSVAQLGVFNRNEQFQSCGRLVHVQCVAGISIPTLIDTNGMTFISTTGGWATVNLKNPFPLFIPPSQLEVSIPGDSYNAYVFDLKFGRASDLIGGPATGLTNDAKLIRTRFIGADRIYPDPYQLTP